MVFIDYQNFNISMKSYLKTQKQDLFNVNFTLLANELNSLVELNPILLKTFLFAHKPCEKLMKIPYYQKHYSWLSSLKNKRYFEVIEGTQEIRNVNKNIKIDILKPDTFDTTEKGTDINLAVHMLSKAYQNSYDVAILVSGDTDYIPVVEVLHQIGKIVILATFPTQNISKYDECRDSHIKMNLDFLKNCIPNNKKIAKN